jgi:mannitol/fructose-specific phosphotransferase system IIA component (Ntr-type)
MSIDTKAIREAGEIAALKEAIKGRQHELANRVWEATVSNGTYVGLGVAIAHAYVLVKEIDDLFKELKSLDPRNK